MAGCSRRASACSLRWDIALISIQGYEPLLPESWPYTEAILREAQTLGLLSALATNGTNLERHAVPLATPGLEGMTVSLDASDADTHDEARRTPGAFGRTVAGLRRVAATPLGEDTIVASVLHPGKGHVLDDMPRLLARLDIRH